MKVGEKIDSKQFTKDPLNEFTQRKNTLEANLVVIYKATPLARKV